MLGDTMDTPQQPTLDLDLPLSESLLPCCSQAIRGCVLGDGHDQTALLSLPKNPARGCNYPPLKKERSLTLQVWPQHQQVSGNESLGEWSRAVCESWPCQEGGGTGPPPAKNLIIFGNREDKDLQS